MIMSIRAMEEDPVETGIPSGYGRGPGGAIGDNHKLVESKGLGANLCLTEESVGEHHGRSDREAQRDDKIGVSSTMLVRGRKDTSNTLCLTSDSGIPESENYSWTSRSGKEVGLSSMIDRISTDGQVDATATLSGELAKDWFLSFPPCLKLAQK